MIDLNAAGGSPWKDKAATQRPRVQVVSPAGTHARAECELTTSRQTQLEIFSFSLLQEADSTLKEGAAASQRS